VSDNLIVAAFLLAILCALVFGAWIVVRQERAARHYGDQDGDQ
jgi:hypothetical protein